MVLNTNTFWKHWKKNFDVARHRNLLLALSGGRDSMALAHLLLACKIPFEAAHMNYQLRGEQSEADQKFIADWCKINDIPLHATKVNLNQNISIQEEARKLRYNWFLSLLESRNLHFVLTAHHADDVAETLLINLSKGTGIKGLHGIIPQKEKLLRPLLPWSRVEINRWIKEENISFREDESNASNKYLRNYFRLEVLPVIEKMLPGSTKRMAETAARLQGVEAIYYRAVEKEIARLVEPRGKDIYLPLLKLKKHEQASTVLYEWLRNYNFTPAQMPDIWALTEAQSGKWVDSGAHRLLKNRNFFILTPLEEMNSDWVIVTQDKEKIIIEGGTLSTRIITKISENLTPQLALLDENKLSYPLHLRRWKKGDYFYPQGMKKKMKKLNRFFIDQKVPLHQKDKIWVLCSGEQIVWVVGYRVDERFMATTSTKEIREMSWTPTAL